MPDNKPQSYEYIASFLGATLTREIINQSEVFILSNNKTNICVQANTLEKAKQRYIETIIDNINLVSQYYNYINF